MINIQLQTSCSQKFFDANYDGLEYDPVEARAGVGLGKGQSGGGGGGGGGGGIPTHTRPPPVRQHSNGHQRPGPVPRHSSKQLYILSFDKILFDGSILFTARSRGGAEGGGRGGGRRGGRTNRGAEPAGARHEAHHRGAREGEGLLLREAEGHRGEGCRVQTDGGR